MSVGLIGNGNDSPFLPLEIFFVTGAGPRLPPDSAELRPWPELANDDAEEAEEILPVVLDVGNPL